MDDMPSTSRAAFRRRRRRTNLSRVPRSINLMHRLIDRENNNFDRYKILTHAKMPATLMLPELEMLKCLPPNLTLLDVNRNDGFVKKFSPDGQILLSFTEDQKYLEIFEYRGIGAMSEMLYRKTSECLAPTDDCDESEYIRTAAFHEMFDKRHSLRMRHGYRNAFLNREFCIFISAEGKQFAMVVSSGASTTMPNPRDLRSYPDLRVDCEMNFYNFFLVDLVYDYVADYITYRSDCIQTTHNVDVSSINNVVAIFSRYRQCIDLYRIKDSIFNLVARIGVYGVHVRRPSPLLVSRGPARPNAPVMLSHFKQRILTFLYRHAWDEKDVEIKRAKLMEFYKNFGKHERMIIVKMQLIEPGIVLLLYAEPTEDEPDPECADSDDEDQLLSFKLYVFYRIKTEKVLRIFDGSSYELMRVIRDYIDSFRNVRSLQTGRRPSSSGNNVYLRKAFDSTVKKLPHPAPYINRMLPVSTQIYSASPYLDHDRYIFSNSQISTCERARIKTSSENVIVFRDRVTKRVLFRMTLDPGPPALPTNQYGYILRGTDAIKMIEFIFHPYEPFIISLQKTGNYTVINFHMYNPPTIVRQDQ